MKNVSKWETTDGKLFDNRDEAHNHEQRTMAEATVRDILHNAMKTGRADAICSLMVHEDFVVAVRDALSKLIRSTKKPIIKLSEAA